MKNIRTITGLALILCLTASCSKEAIRKTTPMTLTLGFEDSEEPAAKTYLSGGKIAWGSGERKVYVFDSAGNKNTFTANNSGATRTATFTGTITEGSTVKYVIYTGKKTGDTSALDAEDNITGVALADQKPSNTSSFAQGSNIAVMKASDDKLKNVYGYIKMTVPKGETNSRIYSVKVSADENLKGSLKIVYTGTVPVASIFENGSKEITIYPRWKDKIGYEAGTYYLELVPGTYHNLKLTITPFEANGGEGTFAGGQIGKSGCTNTLGTPFTISAKSAVTIERNKYVDAGTIPYEEPSSKAGLTTTADFEKGWSL